MPLARLHAPFDHPDWLFEPKYDGFPALACEAILDGEIVHLDANGKPRFYHLCFAIIPSACNRLTWNRMKTDDRETCQSSFCPSFDSFDS